MKRPEFAGRHALPLLMLLLSRPLSADCPLPVLTDDGDGGAWRYLSHLEIAGVFERPVKLKGGQYQGAPFVEGGHSRPELRLWPELSAVGDLNGQPGDEIVGLLSETSGGSGERVYLLVAQPKGENEVEAWPAALLGDRVKIRSLRVGDETILVETVESGDGEPMCCGTRLRRQIWRLSGDRLTLETSEELGQLSLAVLQGPTWYLLDRPGDRLQAVHPSCTYLTIDGERIILETEGVHFTGRIAESAPGAIVISGLTPIDELAITSPENKLLARLSALTNYTFRAGRLYMSGSFEQQPVAFEFASLADVADRPD